MGTVIPFPFEKLSRNRPTAPRRHEPATVVILPVVRIERWSERRQLKQPAAIAKSPRSQAQSSE